MAVTSGSLLHQDTSILTTKLVCESQKITFLVDPDAATTIMDMEKYRRHFAHIPHKSTRQILKGASGTMLQVVGDIMVKVQRNNSVLELPLILVQNKLERPILGRTWL